jgi:phosphoribosyl 1,2-cyclic phosphate phosphodiesterase|tara:strand:+ start:1307 stop:2083 length:777 start_codon:yes stop_codon:yes gene_type:complete
MKITILGSGHSGGTPMIGEGWATTDLKNPKNLRLRPAILVEDQNTRILVDTPPDLRAQLLAAQVERLDAVLYTHGHADHLHGIDDLRAVNRVIEDWLPAYADTNTWNRIAERFGYVLEPLNNDTNFFYKPCLTRHDIAVGDEFNIGDFNISIMDQDHGYSRTLGLRFDNFAYSTDAVELPDETFDALKGVDTWLVGALWDQDPHPTHSHVDKVLEWGERVQPRRLILTHLSHRIDFDTVSARLPDYAELAYDGMVFEV